MRATIPATIALGTTKSITILKYAMEQMTRAIHIMQNVLVEVAIVVILIRPKHGMVTAKNHGIFTVRTIACIILRWIVVCVNAD